MLKKPAQLLVVLTMLLIAGLGGYFLGKSHGLAQAIPSAGQTEQPLSAPAATQVPLRELPAAREETQASAAFPIPINTCSEDTLTNLPGIGPVLARRIVEYREQNGPFTSYDDLTKVKGIGEKILEGIKDYITLE